MAMLAAAPVLPLPDVVAAEPMEPESRYIVPHTMSSTLSGLVTFEQVQETQYFVPKTTLGQKLLALRKKAVSDGMELWDEERVADEVQARRKED